eukprot:TRINITY_DN41903_c0_g1_i1.p1 TRINITY_DN41903_c0_g1~~TRINITY_DN41903_c0_g1_i1.p1  ORF type:complete len:285 (+),score=53.87 TRINITY_DN41903_c0_g1_i1:52-855(+)
MDASQREALLSNPAVQEALQQAGKDALADPAVQQQILATCREKFPELAEKAASEISTWAHDPVVQSQLAHLAVRAASAAAAAPRQLRSLIEKGEPGVRRIACTCGLFSAFWSFLGIVNIFKLLSPMEYIINLYLAVFGLTTAMFEASPTWVARVPTLKAYQEGLIDNARFLCKCWGRGLFYIFQGSLWVAQCDFTSFVSLTLGFMLCFTGVLNVLIFFGIQPQRAVESCIDSLGGHRAQSRGVRAGETEVVQQRVEATTHATGAGEL